MNAVVLPLLVPLLAALACLAFTGATARRLTALVGSSAQVVVALGFVIATRHGERFGLPLGGWKAPAGIVLVIDTLSAIMLALASILLLAAVVYDVSSRGVWKEHPLRAPLLQFLAIGVNLSFITGDFFNLFVAFEVKLLSSYALLTLESRGSDVRHGFQYVVMNIVGSTLFLCLAGFAYGMWGTLNLADLGGKLATEPQRARVVLFAVLSALVFGLKAGLFPLYFWLPRSYPALPAAIAGLFAGLLTKVGIYVLLRMFATVLPHDMREAHALVGWLSVGTMILGVLGALSRPTIRGVLSYHVISQVGYMTLCIGLFSPLAVTACIVYVVHHIVVKGTLFLIGGVAARLQGTDDLARMGGLARTAPWLATAFVLQAFSLAGIPPLSGFWGKYVIVLEALRQERVVFAAAAVVAGVLTLVSMLKIWIGAFWGRAPEGHGPKPGSATRVPLFTSLALVCLSLAIGLGFPTVFRLAEVAARSALDGPGYAAFVASLQGK